MKNKKQILKLICGAANEDCSEIEKLSFIYSSAGFNMIDTIAELNAVNAVKAGIKRAGRENEVIICISIGLEEDIHISKAVIDKTLCSSCGKCSAVCSRNAVIKKEGVFSINETRCIGCGRCIEECSQKAAKRINKYKSPDERLLPLKDTGISLVEFHCTSEDENKILKEWNKIKSIYKGELSICMNRSKLGGDKIINLLKQMISGLDNVIIQADGKPMSGGADDYKSSLQTVSFAALIRDAGINIPVILSGGTNLKTAELTRLLEVDIDGIALGSYARKLVKEYIAAPDFFQNKDLQKAAVQKASAAACRIKNIKLLK